MAQFREEAFVGLCTLVLEPEIQTHQLVWIPLSWEWKWRDLSPKESKPVHTRSNPSVWNEALSPGYHVASEWELSYKYTSWFWLVIGQLTLQQAHSDMDESKSNTSPVTYWVVLGWILQAPSGSLLLICKMEVIRIYQELLWKYKERMWVKALTMVTGTYKCSRNSRYYYASHWWFPKGKKGHK